MVRLALHRVTDRPSASATRFPGRHPRASGDPWTSRRRQSTFKGSRFRGNDGMRRPERSVAHAAPGTSPSRRWPRAPSTELRA